MKKSILLLGIVLALAGCARDGKLIEVDVPNKCFDGNGRGLSYTPVMYGDSYLTVIEVTEVTYGSQWFFRLNPQRQPTDPEGVNYETVDVTIRAANAENRDWLDSTTTYSSSDGKFYVCVPQDESEVVTDADGVFKYDVIVEEVGRLDPRGRVMD
jgi:hypothetical protein